jgi:hypothetical protein
MYWLVDKIHSTIDSIALDMNQTEWTVVALALIVVGSICMRGHVNKNF